MNLLVLRLATINAEEQVQERLEAAEARRNAVHLEGDVIQPNTRLFNTTEKPEQLDTISVCSCACLDYKIWHSRRKKAPNRTNKNRSNPAKLKEESITSSFTTNNENNNNSNYNNNAIIVSNNSGIDSPNHNEGFLSLLKLRKFRVKRLLSGRKLKHQNVLLNNLNNQTNEFEMIAAAKNDVSTPTPPLPLPETNVNSDLEENIVNLDAINVYSNVKRNSI